MSPSSTFLKRPAISVGACALLLFAMVSAVAILYSLWTFDWPKYSEAIEAAALERGAVSGTPLGIGVMTIVATHLFFSAVGVVLPVSAAIALVRTRLWAVWAVVTLVVAALVATYLSTSWGLPLLLLACGSFAIVVSIRYWKTASGLPFDRVDRICFAYVLFVGAGLLGLHNFFTGRAWAGFLCILCTLLATFGWGSILGYLALAGLVFLLFFDAVCIPARCRASRSASYLRRRKLD